MASRLMLVLTVCVTATACQQPDPPATQAPIVSPASSATAARAQAPPTPELAEHLGHCVVAEGYRSGGKIGPRLKLGERSLWVSLSAPAGDDAWWAIPGGSRVRIEGVVGQRDDLPVFIPQPGEVARQGMPMPEGTDLKKARRRFVVENAKVTPLRSLADVNQELARQVGKSVSLSGILWSLNGHWWFNHDGVELHLNNRDVIVDWRDKHGRAVTLHGALSQKPMPRIDQITIKSQRDLAEAFVLTMTKSAPHPPSAIKRCD